MIDLPRECCHRACWIMADPCRILRDGWIHAWKGRVCELGRGKTPASVPVVDHGPAVLMPALVNAHTHLELAALKGRLSAGMGFLDWVAQVIDRREALGPDGLARAIPSAVAELIRTGTGVAGEIATLGLSAETMAAGRLGGIWFREYLGSGAAPALPMDTGSERLPISLAGHAPHTTAPALLRELKRLTRAMGRPFSIHLAESHAEVQFITTGRGPWGAFMERRGIATDDWRLPAASPVAHAHRLGILDAGTVAVHLLHLAPGDLELLRKGGVHGCLCPRSNRHIHGRLPDVAALVKAGIPLCLGTDSLASVESLDLWAEMALLARTFPFLAPDAILAMATVNGAAALGLGAVWGALEPGRPARWIVVATPAGSKTDLLEGLVHNQHRSTVAHYYFQE